MFDGSRCRRLSLLQAKGILTLCLLLLAESVTIVNAAKMWSTYQTGFGDDFTCKERRAPFWKPFVERKECLDLGASSCATGGPSPPGLQPFRILPKALGRLSKHLSIGGGRSYPDCCLDCAHCMSESQAAKLCHAIPRGGHGVRAAAGAAADAASAAASMTTDAIKPLYGIPLNGWKVIFQAILTTINVLCWLIPLRSKQMSENKLGLSIANAFSGGVFLSLAFGHLIPECVHGFDGYNEVTPYLLVLAGYLLIFFVEKVAFDAHDILHEMEHGQEHDAKDQKKNVENGDSKAAEKSSGRSAVILLGALAVHSILEMTALGLADTFGDCAILTLSIALHQVK